MPKKGQRDRDHQEDPSRQTHRPTPEGPSGHHSPGLGTNEPEHFDRDLRADPSSGQNFGPGSRHQGMPSAYDVKDLSRELPNLTDDELKQLPVV